MLYENWKQRALESAKDRYVKDDSFDLRDFESAVGDLFADSATPNEWCDKHGFDAAESVIPSFEGATIYV